jgi:hypothetical protein
VSDLTPEQRNRAAVHKAMEIIVENEITGVSEWRYNLTDRLTEAALSALRAATPGDGLDDAGNIERNHYDWFMPSDPALSVDGYLDDFEAKMRLALTDPFVHDMAQAVLPLIAAYREALTYHDDAGLDVERLRRAADNVREMDPLDYLDDGDETDAIAAEYARLAATEQGERT